LQAGPSGGGGLDERLLEKLNSALETLASGVDDAAKGVVTFGSNVVAHADEISRAKAAFEDLSSKVIGPMVEQFAGALSNEAGQVVGKIRRGLGAFTATSSAAQELEDLATRSAYGGMPLDEGLERDLYPLLKQRAKSVEAARQQAHGITAKDLEEESLWTDLKRRHNRATDSLGDDYYEIGSKIADKLDHVLRERLGGHGR